MRGNILDCYTDDHHRRRRDEPRQCSRCGRSKSRQYRESDHRTRLLDYPDGRRIRIYSQSFGQIPKYTMGRTVYHLIHGTRYAREVTRQSTLRRYDLRNTRIKHLYDAPDSSSGMIRYTPDQIPQNGSLIFL